MMQGPWKSRGKKTSKTTTKGASELATRRASTERLHILQPLSRQGQDWHPSTKSGLEKP
jgi:hypothetical protein